MCKFFRFLLKLIIEPRQEKTNFTLCKQHRCRWACVSAQSGQLLFYSLPGQYNAYTCTGYIRNFKTLASFNSRAHRFKSYLVANLWRLVFSWRNSNEKQIKRQWSGTDTIEFHTLPQTQNGKGTRTTKTALKSEKPSGQLFPNRWPHGYPK